MKNFDGDRFLLPENVTKRIFAKYPKAGTFMIDHMDEGMTGPAWFVLGFVTGCDPEFRPYFQRIFEEINEGAWTEVDA